jgi:hypothetical protein
MAKNSGFSPLSLGMVGVISRAAEGERLTWIDRETREQIWDSVALSHSDLLNQLEGVGFTAPRRAASPTVAVKPGIASTRRRHRAVHLAFISSQPANGNAKHTG